MSGISAATKRILLIDDDSVDAEAVRRELARSERLAAELRHQSNLSAGIDALHTGGFDLLLLDLNLPDSRGLETLDRVLEADCGVPVVVLTGASDASLGQEAVGRGAADYLSKDLLGSEVLERSVIYALERWARRRQIEESQAKLSQALAKQQLAVSEKLHDGVIQHLTTSQRVIEELASRLRGEEHPCAVLASRLQSLVEETRADIRAVIKGAPPPALSKLGLAAALEKLAGRAHSDGRLACRCNAEPTIRASDPNVSMQLYYIAQQALNNAMEHAAASEVRLSLSRRRRLVLLRVADNGRGFNPLALDPGHGGWGLRSMRNRALAIGARLVVRTAPGKGTVVQCGINERRLIA